MQKQLDYFKNLENRQKFATFDRAIKDAIESLKPDLIFVDGGETMPAVKYSGIPWIQILTTNPIYFVFDDDLQPGGFGK